MGDLQSIAYSTLHSSSLGWSFHNLEVLKADKPQFFDRSISTSTPPLLSYFPSDFSTGYLQDVLSEFSSKRRRSEFCYRDGQHEELDNPSRNCWSSKHSPNYYGNYDYLGQIITKSDSISGEAMSRMSEEASLFSETKTTEEAMSNFEAFDISSSHKESITNIQPISNKEDLRSIDLAFPSEGGGVVGEKRKKGMLSKVLYPFAVVKPGGLEGEVTLNNINERILMPPTRPVRHPVGDFACRPLISPDGPGLLGKEVVALTRIHTKGRGTITIIRTRG